MLKDDADDLDKLVLIGWSTADRLFSCAVGYDHRDESAKEMLN